MSTYATAFSWAHVRAVGACFSAFAGLNGIALVLCRPDIIQLEHNFSGSSRLKVHGI